MKGEVKMAYALYESTGNNQESMDKIWDGVWSNLNINKEFSKIENDDLLPIFLKYLPREGKILEGGCGQGKWVFYLKEKGYDIIGIDFAKATIEAIKKNNNKIPIEFGDVTSTRFTDNYFSACISLGVVEHFKEGPFLSLKEAKRILKPNGLLLISIPIFNTARRSLYIFENFYNFLRENKYIRKMYGKSPYHKKHFIEYRYTINEFEQILKELNFIIFNKFTLVHAVCSLFNYFLAPPRFLWAKESRIYQLFDKCSKLLNSRSEWISPHSVIWICKNDKK